MKTPDLRPIAGNARRLAVLSAAMLVAAGPAAANPKGGQVVAGSATISSPSATQLNVNQSTDRAAINWMSFNIAPNEQTSFHQPSSTSMTLNRVQAGDPSIIAGRLNANGQIVLVNPSGIVFSKGSQVDVNALIATPIDISNGNFMAGRMKFDKPLDRPARDRRQQRQDHGRAEGVRRPGGAGCRQCRGDPGEARQGGVGGGGDLYRRFLRRRADQFRCRLEGDGSAARRRRQAAEEPRLEQRRDHRAGRHGAADRRRRCRHRRERRRCSGAGSPRAAPARPRRK